MCGCGCERWVWHVAARRGCKMLEWCVRDVRCQGMIGRRLILTCLYRFLNSLDLGRNVNWLGHIKERSVCSQSCWCWVEIPKAGESFDDVNRNKTREVIIFMIKQLVCFSYLCCASQQGKKKLFLRKSKFTSHSLHCFLWVCKLRLCLLCQRKGCRSIICTQQREKRFIYVFEIKTIVAVAQWVVWCGLV